MSFYDEDGDVFVYSTAVSYTHLDVYKRQVCNGKVLMKDREVLVCDVDKVMADCRQSAQELADDINGGK